MSGPALIYAGPLPDDPSPTTLAEALRRRRLELWLPMSEVARRAGCSPNYPSQFELGVRVPSLPMLARIAHALETTPSELLREIDL